MNKITSAIIIAVVVLAFGAGIYFRDDAIKLYQDFTKQIQDFQTIDLGNMLTEVGKQIFNPPPLEAGEHEAPSNVVLLKSKIIEETNFQRALSSIAPLSPLKENALLNAAATAKAQDMFQNQYFEHVSPAGVGPGTLVQNYGYDYIVAGENLILGNFSSEKQVVADWMASPGHRANILNARFTEIGVAIVKGTYKGESVWIGVQEFGLPLSVCSQPEEGLKAQIDSGRAQLDILSLQIDQLKAQIDSADRKSPAYKQMVQDYNDLVEQYNALAASLKVTISQYNSQVNTFNACVAGQ